MLIKLNQDNLHIDKVVRSLTSPPCLFILRDRDVTSGRKTKMLTTYIYIYKSFNYILD